MTSALVSRPRRAWWPLVAIAAAMLACGLYAYSVQLARGDIATGLRNPGNGGAAWGFYIVFYVYFVGISFAGITVASLARIFHIDTLKPVTRMAELLTIVALCTGALMVLADLGRPLIGLHNLPALARPSSPFYGTFTLVVSGYLFSSLVFFFLAGRADAARMTREGPRVLRPIYRLWASGFRGDDVAHTRHWRSSFWLALTILPLLVIAHSTLGFIFGIQSGRPGWYSALQAPAFVVMAGVSGTGMLILFAILSRTLFHLEDRLPIASIRWLGNFLWVLSLVYLYFMVVEELTASYAGPRAEREIAHAVTEGGFAPSFWITVACLFGAFVIPFVSYLTRKTSLGALAIAAALANVAAVLKRLLIVVPSQTHGGLLQLRPGVYTPTLVEIGVVVGAVGLCAVAMLSFGRVFPLVPTPVEPERRHAKVPREPARSTLTVITALTALGLIAIGLTDSFRLWSHGELDPRIPFAPAIFAGGVMLLFSSAVVYETFPPRRPKLPRMRRVSARAHLRTARDFRARRQP